jgi:cell division protease FtsH
MAGYAAERLVFGTVSSGAENDLKEATKLASKMVAHYGMSQRLGPAYYEHDVEHPFLGQRIATEAGLSDATTHAIEDEARAALTQALAAASALLAQHRSELERLVKALLEQETLEGEALKQLLAPPVVPAAPSPRQLQTARPDPGSIRTTREGKDSADDHSRIYEF